MIKAACYIRVSTEEQVNEGYSIAAQKNAIHRYAEQNGMVIIKEYVDEGASGKSITGRPAMKDLLRDLQNRSFDVLIIYKLDRLARNLRDALQIAEETDLTGVKLISLQESFDTGTPIGKVLFSITGSFAEFERSTIVGRVHLGMDERARQGLWNGGIILGYDVIGKRLQINEQEAHIVRFIFNLAEQGHGYKGIATRINEAGHRTKKGNLFTPNGVKTILENPTYIGKVRFNQVNNWSDKRRQGKNPTPIISDGQHEAIISMQQWNVVHSLKDQRSYQPTRSPEPFLLSGLLRCPACGSPMVPARGKDKRGISHRYYVCGKYHRHGKSACNAFLVPADAAEEVVLTEINSLLQQPGNIRSLIEEIVQQTSGAVEAIEERLASSEEELKTVNRRLDRLVIELADEAVPREILLPQINKYRLQKESLEKTIYELHKSLSKSEGSSLDPAMAVSMFSDLDFRFNQGDPDEKKALLRLLIEDITVSMSTPRRVPAITLAFDLGEQAENPIDIDDLGNAEGFTSSMVRFTF